MLSRKPISRARRMTSIAQGTPRTTMRCSTCAARCMQQRKVCQDRKISNSKIIYLTNSHKRCAQTSAARANTSKRLELRLDPLQNPQASRRHRRPSSCGSAQMLWSSRRAGVIGNPQIIWGPMAALCLLLTTSDLLARLTARITISAS